MNLRLRPVRDEDRPFLVALYGESRAAELALTGWDEATKAAFVEQQFTAQDVHYRRHYADSSLDVVEIGGERAGRLYVHRGPSDIRIVDILLAPAFRGRGIGSRLLGDLIAEADASSCKVSIHVEVNNPARALYERLGLRQAGDEGIYLRMEREPAQLKTAS